MDPNKDSFLDIVSQNNNNYPERKVSGSSKLYSAKREKEQCEKNVLNCIKHSPVVKLMTSALKAAGCEVNPLRHIACEPCFGKIGGGYDPVLNQVVICQNVALKEAMIQGTLTHEFIHMFDHCRANIDFSNLEHLACTEIRAANLLHCSFANAVLFRSASFIRIAKRHQDCVKHIAIKSVASTQGVTIQEATAAVDKVFDKCYNDLEPLGRRMRRNSRDMEKAYRDYYYYEYISN